MFARALFAGLALRLNRANGEWQAYWSTGFLYAA